MGGGGMLRAVGKVVGAGVGGVQEVVSRSNTTAHKRPTTSNPRSLPSSSLASSRNLPVLATSATAPTWLSSSPSHCFCDGDEWEWEPVDGIEDERVNGFYYSSRYALGSVPSMDEVQDAISSLRQVLAPASCSQLVEHGFPSTSDKDVLQSHQCERVYDAFRLFEADLSIKKMVISLSTDKAVWNAILNNEVVRELTQSFSAAEDGSTQSSDVAESILRWILGSAKARIMELIEKITELVNEVFQPPERGKTMDLFDDKLRTSFLLSIVVLFVVVVTRAQGA